MAKMIPSSLRNINQKRTTAGERKLFDLLKTTLDNSCVARYEMMKLGERDYLPDFAVVDPRRGIMIFEVKDYGIEGNEFAQEEFSIRYGNSKIPHPDLNPYIKCETYKGKARKQLIAKATLRNAENDLIVPVEYFIVFTNISRQDFTKNLESFIPPNTVICQDELQDKGILFKKKYEEKLPVIQDPFSKNQLDDITTALFPDLSIPRTASDDGFIKVDKRKQLATIKNLPMYRLSEEQEEAAKNMGDGPRLLEGIAGTGKTLVLLYRAKLIASNPEPPYSKILVLCWNTALANYMQQVYDQFPIDVDPNNKVPIRHFSRFVRELLELPDDPFFTENRGKEREKDEEVTKMLDEYHPKESDMYDYIYVDEAQDFTKEWIEFLYHKLLNGESDKKNMIIAADNAQKIYENRGVNFENLNVPIQVEEKKFLKTIYRNSARVWMFSAFLLEEKAFSVQNSPEKLAFSEKGGIDPQLFKCEDTAGQIKKIIQVIKDIKEDGNALRNILILCWRKSDAEEMKQKLDSENLEADLISRDSRSKRDFDWAAKSIKISTIQSAKGMDSPVVFILLGESNSSIVTEEKIKTLYVGMTRAKEYLAITYSGSKGLVPNVKKCQRDYVKYYKSIIEMENG